MNWISKAIAILKIALSMIPAVIDLVKAIEVPGNGQAKLKAAQEFILAAFELLPDDIMEIITKEKILSFATAIISAIVNFLNLVGVFKHGE